MRPAGRTRPLKVLHVTVSDTGGAGVACLRLHRALRRLGVDSKVLVRTRSTDDHNIIATSSRWHASLTTRLDGLPLKRYPRRQIFAWWSVNWLTGSPPAGVGEWEPDLIHAHWIGDGFVPIEWFKQIGKPIVWTMHDMWPFTGGCHYSDRCDQFKSGCGSCPQLASSSPRDLSFRSAKRKQRAWNPFPGTLVSPGEWLAQTARESLIFRDCPVLVIPNGLDCTLFTPGDRQQARRLLGIPQDAKVVLTGAISAVKDPRKGFSLLVEALSLCRTDAQAAGWRLTVFGADSGPGQDVVGMPVTYSGKIETEQDLVRYYQAADVYVLPSLQDNLPNTVVEALACGIPVVGFRSSGLATMIVDGKTGKLAEPFAPAGLASSIRAVVSRPDSHWRKPCRQKSEETYAFPHPAMQYATLYEELLTHPSRQTEPSALQSPY